MKAPSKTIWRYLALLGLLAISLALYATDLFASVTDVRPKFSTVTIETRGRKEAIDRPKSHDVYETAETTETAPKPGTTDGADRVDLSTGSRRTPPPLHPQEVSVRAADGNAPPKVALLFLTRHTLKPLEGIWTDWLEASPIDWRIMFDVHVHVSDPSSESSALQYPKDSVFRDAVIKEHVSVQWGNHSMITAERALFKEAMKNGLVQSFVLLSEDSAPLYPALLAYMQLILEPKSRINSCGDPSTGDRMAHRWIPRMLDAGLSQDLWRKSSQWVALKRSHVEVVIEDEELDRMFADECYVCTDGVVCFPQRFCVSDEHYIPSLFALKGLEEECACEGMATMTRWEPNAPHPKVFGVTEAQWADEWVIKDEMRDGWNPDRDCGSLRSGRFDDWASGDTKSGLFVGKHEQAEALWNVLMWDEDKRNHLMSPGCPLFVRKISTKEEDVRAWRSALEKFIV